MIEDVRDRTQNLITGACQADGPVLIEAPPASGKTYNAVRLAMQGYSVLYLAGRTDLYDQAEREVEQLKNEEGAGDITVGTIPSPSRDCETFQGTNSGDTQKAKRLYAKGVSAKELHTGRNNVSMPCHTDGSSCEYINNINHLNGGSDNIDILVGNHQHAYNPRYLHNRIVIFDEFNPDPFIERFPSSNSKISDKPSELISEFIQAVDELPPNNITDLIEARARKDEEYEETLEWFLERGADEQTVKKVLDINSSQYNTAHKLSAFLTCALLVMENVGPDMELAYEPELWGKLGVSSEIRCVRDRSSGEILVLEPPPLETAKQVIGLDAVPVKRLWNIVFGCDFDKEQVLERDRIDRYLTEGLGIEVIQVAESRHPYSSGRLSRRDQQRLALVRNVEGRKFPIISRKRALNNYQSRDWFGKCVESVENGDDKYRAQNYGSVLSSNRFKDESLGFISGNPYPGDQVVKRWCALCGEPTQPERSNGEDGGNTLQFSTDLGETIYHHFTHDLVFQAILRFGRTPGESTDASTVYVNTSASPEWLTPRQLTIDDWYNATKRVAVIEDLIRASNAGDRQSWQTIKTLHESVNARLEVTESGPDSVDKEWVRDVLHDEKLASCIEQDPGGGWHGADCFRWNGDEALQQTVGIFEPADHLLVTDTHAMFLKIAKNGQIVS
ncbi:MULTISPECIES: hypothetical protein [Halobacterium]|uniref:hypothetical protein n=1 Tax=Halobacterium TaxID=2239 RepID=UPI000B0B8EBE|nr:MULTISPECIES: hypothetical protein [Halobacterium]MCG1004663.1 hypothetical protein [Halobacterium noricense]